jgi:hypothetical protein
MSVIPKKLVLIKSHPTQLTIQSLLLKESKGKINLVPDYQRDEVWNSEKKTRLIESILGGVMIPAITVNLQDNKYIVIDGKQRITALKEFRNGDIYFYNSDNPDNKCKYNDLLDEYKEKFNDFNISLIEYYNLSNSEQREIFQRINYGENLSVGEKIKGMNSDIIKDIILNKSNISNKSSELNILNEPIEMNISNKLSKLNISNKRESHNECIIALLALYNGDNDYVSKGKPCINYIYKIEKETINIDKFNKTILNYLDKIIRIYSKLKKYAKKRKYKKVKFNWTQILIYIYLFLNNNTIKTENKILTISKYLLHNFNRCKWSELDIDMMNENEMKYFTIFSKRSNTNTKDFFSMREERIDKLYNYIKNKKFSKEERNKIYAKTGTVGESICMICNNHKIYSTNFEAGHIISRNNGGCTEVYNAYPICSTCNKSMNSIDMDLYLNNNKIDNFLLTM